MDNKAAIQNAIKDACSETFVTLFSKDPAFAESEASIEDTGAQSIIASLGFAGQMEGSLVLICRNDVACNIVSQLLGSQIESVSQDVLDGMGEMVNIISGGIKTKFAGLGYSFEISLPSIMQAANPIKIAKLTNASDTAAMKVMLDGDLKFDVIFSYLMVDAAELERRKTAALLEKKDERASSLFKDLINKQGA